MREAHIQQRESSFVTGGRHLSLPHASRRRVASIHQETATPRAVRTPQDGVVCMARGLETGGAGEWRRRTGGGEEERRMTVGFRLLTWFQNNQKKLVLQSSSLAGLASISRRPPAMMVQFAAAGNYCW